MWPTILKLRWEFVHLKVPLTILIQIGFRRLWQENKSRSDDGEESPEEENENKSSCVHLFAETNTAFEDVDFYIIPRSTEITYIIRHEFEQHSWPCFANNCIIEIKNYCPICIIIIVIYFYNSSQAIVNKHCDFHCSVVEDLLGLLVAWLDIHIVMIHAQVNICNCLL